MMASISAGILTPVLAQEVSTAVNDRLEAGDGSVPVPVVDDNSPRHGGGLDVGALISVAYDNNIFLSKEKPEADTVYRAGASVAYTQGDAKEGLGGFIQFAYQPTSVNYAKLRHENRIDHQAAILAGWKGKVTTITYTGGAQKLGDATADTGRPTDRIESKNELRAAWNPVEKVTLEAAVGDEQSDYIDPTFFDSNKVYGEIALRYAYSPKTEIGLAYRAGTFKVDGSGKQEVQQVTANIDWKPREKIRVKLEAGAEHRKTENGTDVNPVLDGRVEWTPYKGTSFYLTAYQHEEASAFYAGQNYRVKGATAGMSQRLGGRWTGRVEGGYETATYSQVSGSGASGRTDKIWFARPALEYRITDACDISLFYRVSDDSSTDSDFGYGQRMAGIELKYQF
jgi:hypothetical protein